MPRRVSLPGADELFGGQPAAPSKPDTSNEGPQRAA